MIFSANSIRPAVNHPMAKARGFRPESLMMEATSAGPITQPKEFVANKPFSCYVYTNTDNGPKIMFYGQYIK